MNSPTCSTGTHQHPIKFYSKFIKSLKVGFFEKSSVCVKPCPARFAARKIIKYHPLPPLASAPLLPLLVPSVRTSRVRRVYLPPHRIHAAYRPVMHSANLPACDNCRASTYRRTMRSAARRPHWCQGQGLPAVRPRGVTNHPAKNRTNRTHKSGPA